MKIKKRILWLFAAALLLAGCGKKQEPENSYKVYYVNTTRTRLRESDYNPKAQTFEEMMDELMEQLKTAPAEAGYVSALPEGTEINGYERGIDALRIDFSSSYYSLSNTDEVLLRAAVVKTFSQVPGVTKIMITVDKEQLKDEDGQPVMPMDANSFIDTKEGGINSYQYATLVLYFANESGDRIVKEMRNLHYSSNMVLERVVVEQLIAGPEDAGLRPVLGSSARIQNVYIQDGVCSISFDEEFNENPSEALLNPEAALYAIVDSICETCDDITGVKFDIDGENDILFRDAVDLNQVFTMDRSLIEQGEMQTENTVREETGE